MSDFWQAPSNGTIVNLEHVVTVDRPVDLRGDLRVVMAVPGATLVLKAGSPEEASFMNAIGQRIGTPAQIISALYDIHEQIGELVLKP